jgi:hypothetical protein
MLGRRRGRHVEVGGQRPQLSGCGQLQKPAEKGDLGEARRTSGFLKEKSFFTT